MLQTTYTLKSARVKSVDFSLTSYKAALALYSGELLLFDLKTQKVVQKREISSSPLRCVRFYKYFVLTASDDGNLTVLDYSSLSYINYIRASRDFLRCIATCRDIIFTAGDDGVLRIWRYDKEFVLLAEGIASSGFVMSIQISKDGKRLATSNQEGEIKIWDVSIFDKYTFDQRLEKGDFDYYKVNQKQKETIQEKSIYITRYAYKIAKLAVQYVLGGDFITSNSKLHYRPLLYSFTPNFTFKAHDGCCNSIDFCECPALQQSNPYADSYAQFVCSCGDDQNVVITDLFSRYPVKTFSFHKDSISCVRFCYQSVFTASEDNTVGIIDMYTFEIQRYLNYTLERAWCVNSIALGCYTCICIGFDYGAIFALYGDNTIVSASCKEKFAIFAYNTNGFEYKMSKSAGVSVVTNLEDKNSESKTLSSIQQCTRLYFSPNSKLLACYDQDAVRLYSINTGKEKMSEQCRSFAFAREFIPSKFILADKLVENEEKIISRSYSDYYPEIEENGIYATIEGKRIYLKYNGEVLSYTETDFTPKIIFSGPILAVAGDSEIAFYNWNLAYLTSFDLKVHSVKFNSAGDVMLLSYDEELYVCAINFGTIMTREIDEVDGLEDAITIFGQLQGCKSASVESGILCYSDGQTIFYVFLQEMASSDAQPMKLSFYESVLDTIRVLDKEVFILCYEGDKFVIKSIYLDTAVMAFRELCSQARYEEAVQVCRSQFMADAARVLNACEILVKAGQKMLLEEISSDNEVMLIVSLKYELYGTMKDVAVKATNLSRKRQAADALFKQGALHTAMEVYNYLYDAEMVLLCAFLCGDTSKLEELSTSADCRVALRARAILGQSIADLLTLANEKAAYENAIEGKGELCAKWKAELPNGDMLE